MGQAVQLMSAQRLTLTIVLKDVGFTSKSVFSAEKEQGCLQVVPT